MIKQIIYTTVPATFFLISAACATLSVEIEERLDRIEAALDNMCEVRESELGLFTRLILNRPRLSNALDEYCNWPSEAETETEEAVENVVD